MNTASWFADSWQLWVLSLGVKVCLVLALAMLLTHLTRRRPAAERHFVWVMAVVAVLALPLVTLGLPSLDVPMRLPATFSDVTPVRADAVVAGPSARVVGSGGTASVAPAVRAAGTGSSAAPTAALRASAVVTPRASTPAASRAPVVSAEPVVAPAAVVERPRRSWTDLLVVVWLAGVGVVLSGVLLGFVRVYAQTGRARLLGDDALAGRAHAIGAELGISGRIRLLEGDADQMPMTFGVVRPTLLLPSAARAWSTARLDTVLRHELAHIRRRDSLTQLAAELACALHWFNPLIWFAARRMYIEREHACDDLVLVSGSRPADYASELLDIARTTRVQRAVPLAAIAMARPSQLRLRIVAVLEERQRRAALSGRLLIPAWVGASALIFPLSSVTPCPREHDAPAEPAVVMAAPSAELDIGGLVPQNYASISPLPSFAPVAVDIGVTEQETCLTRTTRNRSTSTNVNDNRTTIKWSADGCSGDVTIEGTVQFDPDFTTIASISRGGSVRLNIDDGDDERRLVIRPENGGLAYEYSVKGRSATFDEAGRQWLSSSLLFLFRTMGFMAEERATAILERRGSQALLTEVGLLTGDYVRAKYLTVLVDRGQLDEASLRRVLEIAGNTLKSDHYLTEVITAAAGRYTFTDGVRQAYIAAAAKLSSDHYRHAAFAKVVERGDLPPAQLAAVLRESARISSDHYRAELLSGAASRYAMAPAIRSAYLEAAAGIKSDHYKAQVLDGLLQRELNAAELARVVDATQSLSDHYRAGLLEKVAATSLNDATLQTAFVRAASGIKSDHYKQQVLSAAVARSDLSRGALLGVLDAAATIDSDHYLAELLIQITNRNRLEGETRIRFMKVMDGISSSHYKGNVASALLRQERG